MAKKRNKSARGRILELTALFLVGVGLLLAALNAGRGVAVPYAYDDLISQYARENDLDKSLVAAVIWQESRYRPDAVSSQGATGLMQIMPDTARWIAERLDLDYKAPDLKDPEYNIRMGTYYLAYLMKKYDADETLVLAAYNAGPGNVDGWLENSRYSKDGTLTYIPFKETRNYVAKVLQMKGVYRSLYAREFRVRT